MRNLNVQKFELGPIGTNAFLLWEDGGEDAVLVDAPPDAKESIEPILKLRELRLQGFHSRPPPVQLQINLSREDSGLDCLEFYQPKMRNW